MNILDQIKADIERQREEIRPTDTGEMKVVGTPTQLEQGWLNALSWMEKVLDTLQDQPVELEKEVVKICHEYGLSITIRDATILARYYYSLGRQSKEKPVCEDVEEAAKAYADDINSNECLYTYTDFTDAFKAGAKWQKEAILEWAREQEKRLLGGEQEAIQIMIDKIESL